MVGHSIDNGNLQFVKLIGVGTYGEVYMAIDRQTGESYAVKVLPRNQTSAEQPPSIQSRLQRLSTSTSSRRRAATGSSANEQQYVDARTLSREVALYARIPNHGNIVRLERMLHTKDQLFMVMEHCPGGDLYENISTNPYFQLPNNDALIRRLFLQLVSALQHCHKQGVYHRDIKPENVLVTRDGLNVKLIDFGLSTNEPWCREIGCGSAYYMSPECQGGIHTKVDRYAAAPNDVWALGIILINLTTGRNPWNRAHITDPLFRRYLTDKSFLCKAIRATPEFTHIIYRTLDVNPLTRCTMDELQSLAQACPRFIEPVRTSYQPEHPFQKQPVQPTCADFQAPTPAAPVVQQPIPSSYYRVPDPFSAGAIVQAIARAPQAPQLPKQEQHHPQPAPPLCQTGLHYIPFSRVQAADNATLFDRAGLQAPSSTFRRQQEQQPVAAASGTKEPTPFGSSNLHFDFSPTTNTAVSAAASSARTGAKHPIPLFYPAPQPKLDPSPYVAVPGRKLSCHGRRYVCDAAVAAAAAAAAAAVTVKAANATPRTTPKPTALCGGGIC
ncbi:Serine/threonine protein kinase [Coemansia sp. RSA 2399]|nr:Serine/threonine protein kinase [Coemansia sp. RSA 2399]